MITLETVQFGTGNAHGTAYSEAGDLSLTAQDADGFLVEAEFVGHFTTGEHFWLGEDRLRAEGLSALRGENTQAREGGQEGNDLQTRTVRHDRFGLGDDPPYPVRNHWGTLSLNERAAGRVRPLYYFTTLRIVV